MQASNRAARLEPLDRIGLAIRLAWTAAVAVLAGRVGKLTPGLAAALIAWALLTGFGQVFGGAWKWPRWLASLADLTFTVIAIWLTGLASSPLWWSLLVGGLLSSMNFGLLAGLAIPSLGLLLGMGSGFLTGALVTADLAGLGRAVLTILLLAPIFAGLGNWLSRRSVALNPSPSSQPGENGGPTAAMLVLAAELNSELRRERIPQLVVDLALGGLDRGVRMAMLLRDREGYGLAAAYPPPIDRSIVLPGREGILGEALASGDVKTSSQISGDPSLEQLGMTQGSREVVCVPLLANGQADGALLLTHSEPGYLSRQRMELVNAIGAQASIALNNARRVSDLELERDRITETEEEARRKLARNLHDGPTQTIAAIAMRLNFARRLVRRDIAAAESEIQTLEDIARQTTKEIRHMLFTLRPLVLESKGLVVALHQLASKMEETHGQHVEVEALPGVADGLDLSKQAVIFFIAEEAINNSHKHGEAANIRVGLRKAGNDRIALDIWDDGVGFNVGAVDADYEQRGSLGMVNMRERSELINGVLRIESAEGKGTRITLEVPLASDEQ